MQKSINLFLPGLDFTFEMYKISKSLESMSCNKSLDSTKKKLALYEVKDTKAKNGTKLDLTWDLH